MSEKILCANCGKDITNTANIGVGDNECCTIRCSAIHSIKNSSLSESKKSKMLKKWI